MANVGFFVIGGLGLFSLLAGIFPSYFPAHIPESGASALRIVGFVLISVAFTVRSLLRLSGPGEREDKGSTTERSPE